MGLIKWIVLFAITLCLAFVVLITFSQPAFYQTASIVLFTYHTKPYPIFLWVAGGLTIGLLAGFSLALYYYITFKAKIFVRDRQIKKLEQELESVRKIQIVPTVQPSPPPSDLH